MFHYNSSWRDKRHQITFQLSQSQNRSMISGDMKSESYDLSQSAEQKVHHDVNDPNQIQIAWDGISDLMTLREILSKSERERLKLQKQVMRYKSKMKAMKVQFQQTIRVKEEYESLKETVYELQDVLNQQVHAQQASDEMTQSLREELETMTQKYTNLEKDYMNNMSKRYMTSCRSSAMSTPKAPKGWTLTLPDSCHGQLCRQHNELREEDERKKKLIRELQEEINTLKTNNSRNTKCECDQSEMAQQNLEYGKQIANLRAMRYSERKKYEEKVNTLQEEMKQMETERKELEDTWNNDDMEQLRRNNSALSRSLALSRVAKSALEKKVVELSALLEKPQDNLGRET